MQFAIIVACIPCCDCGHYAWAWSIENHLGLQVAVQQPGTMLHDHPAMALADGMAAAKELGYITNDIALKVVS